MTTHEFLNSYHIVHVGGRYTVYIAEHYLLGFVYGANVTVCDKQENCTYASIGRIGTISAIFRKDYRGFPVAQFAKYLVKEALKPGSETFQKYGYAIPDSPYFRGTKPVHTHRCRDTLKNEGTLL